MFNLKMGHFWGSSLIVWSHDKASLYDRSRLFLKTKTRTGFKPTLRDETNKLVPFWLSLFD